MAIYKSLKEHVYEYISEEIFKGNIKPKEKINESTICDALGVSRTPVREALIQLSDDGILELIPRRGFIVNEVSLSKVKEVYAVVGVMEGFAAYLAAVKMDDEQLEILEGYIRDMENAIIERNYKDYYAKQLKFHQIFIKASGNSELVRLIDNMKMKFIKQSYVMDENNENLPEILLKTNNEHKKIMEYFKKRDAKGVETYLREVHWNMTYAAFESVVVPQP